MVASTHGWRLGGVRWLERASAWNRTHPLAGDILIAIVVGVPFAGLSLLVIYGGVDGIRSSIAGRPPWSVVVGCAIAVEPVALAVRRVLPLASFVVVSTAVGAQLLTSIYWFMLSTLLFLPSLYSYCAYGRRPAPAVGFAVGVGGTIVVTALGFALAGRAADVDYMLLHAFVRLLPFVVATWSLGMFRRVRVAYVAALEERAMRAEAEREERARRAVADERARIAREMHDVVAHALSVVISQAQGGRYAARADSDRAVEALGTIAETGRQALADTRGLLQVLRSDTAATEEEDQGSPQPTLGELPELLERVREAGVPVDHAEHGTPTRLGTAAELAVFRLVQEALTNTLKHAGPGAHAEVRLAWAVDGLTVTVSDNGRGTVNTDGGQGLIGMRERLAVVGGSMSAGPAPGGGFRVQARVPSRTQAMKGTSR